MRTSPRVSRPGGRPSSGPTGYHAGMTDTDQGDAGDIRAVARVGQICALFGPQVEELSAADIARLTGLNRTTAYRYATSMVAAGILDRGSRRGAFALGTLMTEIGVRAVGRRRVVEIAGPHLRRLRDGARMTAVLGIRGAPWPIVALVEEDTSHLVVVTVHVGTKLDITAAQTHLFLAHADSRAFEAAVSGASVAQRDRLEADVALARRQGFAVAQHSGGIVVASAPVFDGKEMVATVAVLGPGELRAIAPELDLVRATAAALTCALGG